MTFAACAAALWMAFGGDPAGVDLGELAERHALTRSTDWATGREVLRGSGAHLVLAPGLSTVLWNGAVRTLSEPVRLVRGRVVVPPDVERILAATPSPAAPNPRHRAERAPRSFKIVLDPGHGGRHPGWRGEGGLLEKDVNLDVGLRLRDLLRSYGVDVVMTRTRDTHLAPTVNEDLEERLALANGARPDFFLSIHSNGHTGAHARGFEVFVARDLRGERRSSLDMAREIQMQFRRGLDTEDRGIKEAGFRVLKGTSCPAVLVELEFLSNPRGERELGDPAHRQKLAELLFAAIKRYIARS